VRVLVTGAGGYIGGRLVPVLLERGHEVVATFSRGTPPAGLWWLDRVETAAMDVLQPDQVAAAVQGVDAVVYLVHGLGGADFAVKDREGATNLAEAAAAAGVGRIVYLSGLVPQVDEGELSPHIASRLEVERILAASGVPTITARAAVVVGSGSTSFEIVRQLSERMPVQTVPTWMDHQVQPIAVVDVLEVLAGCLDLPAETRTYDVGGPERLRYPELLRVYADVARIIRPQVPVPVVPSVLVGQIAGRLTGVPTVTVASLVESLHHDMVCADDAFAADLLPDGHACLGVREAVARALTRPKAGTRVRDRDPMGALPPDPAWAGGEVYLFNGVTKHRPRSLLRRALLGVRRPW
jgi:uncharacterized protein YbjT (DUF2867 family)